MQKKLYWFIILLFMVPLALPAQKLKVESFEQRKSAIIPKSQQRNDLDKVPCALVKVQVLDSITKVEGNVMGEVARHDIEQWVFLTEGTKKFTLKFKNHFEVYIETGDYGIDKLESNCTYVLTLIDPSPSPAPDVRKTDTGSRTPTVSKKVTTPATSPLPAPVKAGDGEPPVSFGLRAGLNLCTTQFDSQYSGTGNVTGFHAGVDVSVRLSSLFSLSGGLLYSGKGYKYDDGTVVETAKAGYIDVPLQAVLRLPLGSSLAVQFGVGPYVAVGLSGSIKDDKASTYDQPFFDKYGSFDYGLQAGASLVVSRHFLVGASYQAGMGDYRNRNLAITLGYDF